MSVGPLFILGGVVVVVVAAILIWVVMDSKRSG